MWCSLSIGGSSSVQWRSWILHLCFRHLLLLLYVRIEIDQLQCWNRWVIIHCLSVSCMKINHSRYWLMIWSSLHLTFKQWIINQQFTARADLFLKQTIFWDWNYSKFGNSHLTLVWTVPKSKWVWSGNATNSITQCRPTHGTVSLLYEGRRQNPLAKAPPIICSRRQFQILLLFQK